MIAAAQPDVIAYLVSTGPESVAVEQARSVLTGDELLRGNRFVFREDAERWLRGRYWVRILLSTQLGVPADKISFTKNRWGKPRMADLEGGFDFNVSHSSEWIAVALSRAGEVGIDIETVRHDFPALEIAEQFFTASENAALARVNRHDRQQLFVQLWTAKEALMKATGLGFELPPEAVDLRIGEDGPESYRAQKDFSFVQCEWRPGLWAAIAMRCTDLTIEWRDLTESWQAGASVA